MTFPKNIPITFVGHPFASIGRGEDIRCAVRAARRVGIPFSIINLDQKGHYADQALEAEFDEYLTDHLSPDVNIFFINGDEIDRVRRFLPGMEDSQAYQIISPQWELEKYPQIWAKEINRFDEVWAPSRFVLMSLKDAVSIPVIHMPLSVEVKLDSFLPRRYFGLPESSFLFLFFFDFSSYLDRKNPSAVIDAFQQIIKVVGDGDFRLVMKTNIPWYSERLQKLQQEFIHQLDLSPIRKKIIQFHESMTDNEIKNFIRCCDSFVSLHRSEGFGRGLAEAMALGKPVIGTGYSGNIDFMHSGNALLVDYDLVPLRQGQYPFYEGQVWADPDIQQAAEYMVELIENKDSARELGRLARRHMKTNYSYRAVGLKYRNRIQQIKSRY